MHSRERHHYVLTLTNLVYKTSIVWDSMPQPEPPLDVARSLQYYFCNIFNPSLADEKHIICRAKTYIQQDDWSCGLFCVLHAWVCLVAPPLDGPARFDAPTTTGAIDVARFFKDRFRQFVGGPRTGVE